MSSETDTVTQQTDVPAWVRPYAENYMLQSANVAARPYEAFQGQTVAQMNPYMTQGLNAQAQRAMQGSPINEAAGAEATRTLQGGYLNNNPYLSGMIDNVSRDVNRNFDQVDARSGSFGNSGVAEARSRGLSDVATNIRGQDYAAERGRMLQTLGMSPTLANQDYVDAGNLIQAGQGFQRQEQSNMDDDLRRFTEARDYPERQLGVMGRGLGMNFGTSSTSTQPGANPFAQALGTAATVKGMGK